MYSKRVSGLIIFEQFKLIIFEFINNMRKLKYIEILKKLINIQYFNLNMENTHLQGQRGLNDTTPSK